MGQQRDISAIYGKFEPTGSISQNQPRVTWKLTPTGGGKVSRVEMLINNEPVQAEFNTDRNEVIYTPDDPMEPGLHSVTCRVTIERAVTVRQDWTFEVAGLVAMDNRPGKSVAASYALNATNDYRSALGMKPFALDDKMSSAATAHSKYQVLNRAVGHYEEPGKPGYTGKAPWDRTAHFGFEGVCYEGVCGNQTDPRKAIELLFNAPYHRIPFLQPGAPKVGIGFEGGILTVNYAVSDDAGVGVSPGANQSGVPLDWDGNESPSPLRVHGYNGHTGYPVVFAYFSPNLENIDVQSMKLFAPDGTQVTAFVNTPSNDPELRFAGILTPRARLQPLTTYRVEVKAKTKRGGKLDKTWSFTTGNK